MDKNRRRGIRRAHRIRTRDWNNHRGWNKYRHHDCPCWSSGYEDRNSCRGCIRRANWQAGEDAMDADYADWLSERRVRSAATP